MGRINKKGTINPLMLKWILIGAAAVVATVVAVVAVNHMGNTDGDSKQHSGQQAVSQKEKADEWVTIDDENTYTDLIDGGISADQLKKALALFYEPIDTEGINAAFKEYSYWFILEICGLSDDNETDDSGVFITYKYDLTEVNDTLKGITDFQYEKDAQYSDNEYTDDKRLYLTVLPTDDDTVRTIDSIKGKHNEEEMVLDYDLLTEEHDSTGNLKKYSHSMRAVFVKQKNGKFKLKEIEYASTGKAPGWDKFLSNSMIGKSYSDVEKKYGGLSLRNSELYSTWNDFTGIAEDFYFVDDEKPVFTFGGVQGDECIAMEGTMEQLFGITEPISIKELEKSILPDQEFTITWTTDVLYTNWQTTKFDGVNYDISIFPESLRNTTPIDEEAYFSGDGWQDATADTIKEIYKGYEGDPTMIYPSTLLMCDKEVIEV